MRSITCHTAHLMPPLLALLFPVPGDAKLNRVADVKIEGNRETHAGVIREALAFRGGDDLAEEQV